MDKTTWLDDGVDSYKKAGLCSCFLLLPQPDGWPPRAPAHLPQGHASLPHVRIFQQAVVVIHLLGWVRVGVGFGRRGQPAAFIEPV